MADRETYEAGKAPRYLATRHQLAEKKLVPLKDPVAVVRTSSGKLIDLYDWRETKHSRFATTTNNT